MYVAAPSLFTGHFSHKLYTMKCHGTSGISTSTHYTHCDILMQTLWNSLACSIIIMPDKPTPSLHCSQNQCIFTSSRSVLFPSVIVYLYADPFPLITVSIYHTQLIICCKCHTSDEQEHHNPAYLKLKGREYSMLKIYQIKPCWSINGQPLHQVAGYS